MKTASGTLTTILNSNVQYKMADLLLIYNLPTSPSAIAMCSADIPIYDGVIFTYQPTSVSGLSFKRSRTQLSIGLQVDELDVTVMGSALYNGIPLNQAVANGLLDGARVYLQRAFMPEWGDTTPGLLWMFSGRVSDVEISRNQIRIKVKSDLELLDSDFPRNLFMPSCTNTLFDPACGVVKATYTTAATVAAGASTTTHIKVTNAQATGYFELGTVTFTSGQNIGAKRTVKTFTAGTPADIGLSLPLPYVPQVGDAFSFVPGCDKTKAGGCTKFSNTPRYRGFRFIPRPETMR